MTATTRLHTFLLQPAASFGRSSRTHQSVGLLKAKPSVGDLSRTSNCKERLAGKTKFTEEARKERGESRPRLDSFFGRGIRERRPSRFFRRRTLIFLSVPRKWAENCIVFFTNSKPSSTG